MQLRIVMIDLAVLLEIEYHLPAGFERRRQLGIKPRDAGSAGVLGSLFEGKSGTRPNPRYIRLAVAGAPYRLSTPCFRGLPGFRLTGGSLAGGRHGCERQNGEHCGGDDQRSKTTFHLKSPNFGYVLGFATIRNSHSPGVSN